MKIITTLALALFTTAAFAQPADILISGEGDAAMLTTAEGMTLYTFDNDGTNKSNCSGSCAASWPPLAATEAENDGDFTTIERKDGTHQWAYKGQPLYTWVLDMEAGQTTGDGVGGVWHLAKF